MKIETFKSPAKLNLFLKLVNKREDGFHNIISLFERIDLFDIIKIKIIDSKDYIKIVCNNSSVPTGPKNIIYKIIVLLRQDYDFKKGITVYLDKKIPVAAGLAGGSTNAATVLMGLSKMLKLNLSKKQLIDYAKRVGSDVPFFIEQASWAIGTERGDKIKSLNIKAKLWHVVVTPKIKMYSWRVYGQVNLKLTKPNDNVNILIHNLKNNNINDTSRLIINDLQDIVLELCPSIGKLVERLKLFEVQGVMVSGSGPSVYAIVDSKKKAEYIKSKLDNKYSQVYIVRTF